MLSRRDVLRHLGTATATLPLVSTGLFRRRFAAGDFTELRRGVGIFREHGGTIGWLINDEGVLVVDTQYPKSAPDCWNGLQSRTDQSLALVINTHHHGDHVGGNGVFDQYTDRFVAHTNVPNLMKRAAEDDSAENQTYPNETFDREWSETVGGETVTLQHYGPAHTGGDAVVYFEEANIAHVGDLVFNRAYPFIDVDGGASSTNWITSLETVYEILDDDSIVIHGHANPEFGPSGSRDDLLVMRDFLSALNEYVQQHRQAGASLDEMKETDVLDGFESFDFDWPLSLGDCIEAVYREQTS